MIFTSSILQPLNALASLIDKDFNTKLVNSAQSVDFDYKAESNNALSFWLRTILSRF